jgi:glyoxylase-like metal-dependent hydrolase (beta-lactamase superfamily II)
MTRLYAFHCCGDFLDKAIADPFDPAVGTKVYVPWFFYVIVHPQGNVIFDSGLDPELANDPRSHLGSWADILDLRIEPGTDVVSQLSSIGLSPRDIDLVIVSHLHFDHVSALPLFRHATIMVQRPELSFARHPAVYQAGTYNQSDFAGDFRWEVLDGPRDVFDDRQLEIYPTAGHTPGHQSLLFRGLRDHVMLLGDATYSLTKMRARLLPSMLWSPDAMVSSWQFIEWIEEREEATLLYTHDEGYKRRVRLAPSGWYE